ncbi:SCA7 domain-containing protein [Neofusicoccum parvum]|uniref:SCA7 domain-containing protein n=2 Tax=Neofusicoccum parvum TaxID=310453 RepID=A0ACB5SCV5_9PEZI|nr:putative saga complex component protein [Neofusicoccum parvum UCRNP2]GME35029.1 SCA7 domain-containing protein [Neofusicoccum parvum]GME61684.1 SCA7 domain-containing protein [Neofusicoccum parvum]
MVANGARKSSKQSLVDARAYDGIFTDKDKKPATFKLRKSNVKQSQPGNWKESEITDANDKKIPPPSAPASPLVNQLDEKTTAAFPTNRPLDDHLDTVQCRHCRRPVLRTAAKDHIKECLDKKQAKLKKKKEAKEAKEAAIRREKGIADDDDDGPPKNARKSAKGALDGEGAKKSKKRKADGDAEKAPAKKKKKDEPKAKVPKPKGPVDVEKQCGVLLPNGSMCARSLTCKSHSMGAKRAVPGRSLPYDMLLAQYQKKNQAKQQRAAIDANAPLPEDFDNHAPIDSDEEKDAIMAAIARSRPQPLVSRPLVSMQSKYRNIRIKEMLQNAMGGSRGAGLFSTGLPPANNNHGHPPQSAATTDGGMAAPPRASISTGYLSGIFGSADPGTAFAGFMSGANAAAGGDGMSMDGSGGGLAGRRQASIGGHGPRQILPGQLPPPSRKQSVSGVGAVG